MPLTKSFYLKLYWFWLSYIALRTLVLSSTLSFLTSLIIYIYKGAGTLNKESFLALKTIFYFSFPAFFSLSLILMLLLVFKAVFTREISGYNLSLYDCKDKRIESPLLSDIVMLWRKWLFLSLWIIIIFLVIFLGIYTVFTGELPSEWINGISLSFLISIFGGIVFVLGLSKCKKVRIKDA